MGEHTPEPWQAVRLVHAETGLPMTPDEIGEYVKNSVIKSLEQSGTTDFMAVMCEKGDGSYDVCHVGNGPTSPANAALIAQAPTLLRQRDELLELLRPFADMWCGEAKPGEDECECHNCTAYQYIAAIERIEP